MTLLTVSDLSVSLRERQVLSDVSLSVAPGEFVGLIGPNGAGKSTLLRAVMQFVSSTGTISIDGRDAAATGAKERSRLISYLPQERDVAWAVPVDMLVSLGRAPHRPGFGPLTRQDQAAVDEAMQRMDVMQFRDRPATELSGGELARVLIARLLAQQTPLMLADEPTAGLDPSHQISLMRIFAGLAAEGKAVIASLHDLGLAARWCTRLILLHEERILADGAPETVLSDDNVRTAYNVTLYSKHVDGNWVVQPLDIVADRPGENR